MSCLVLGSRSRIANAIVRGLGSRGVTVFTADTIAITRSSLSRFVSRHYTYTSLQQSESLFWDDLRHIFEASSAKVLLTGDFSLYNYLIRNKDRLDNNIRFFAPDVEQVESLATKDRLIDVAAAMDVLTPKSVLVHDLNETLELCRDLPFPVLVKPVDECHGRGISVAADLECLLSRIPKYDREKLAAGLVVQEFIEGHNFGAAVVMENGEFRAGLCYRQIHQQPVSGGTPTLTETSDFSAPVEMLGKILARHKWHGLCQADFIVGKATGKVYLIDINPRMFGALFTSVAAGINFPYLLYQMSQGLSGEPGPGFGQKVRTVWIEGEAKRLLGDLLHLRKFAKATNFCEYKLGTQIEDWAFGDFKPFLLAPLWYLAQMASRS